MQTGDRWNEIAYNFKSDQSKVDGAASILKISQFVSNSEIKKMKKRLF